MLAEALISVSFDYVFLVCGASDAEFPSVLERLRSLPLDALWVLPVAGSPGLVCRGRARFSSVRQLPDLLRLLPDLVIVWQEYDAAAARRFYGCDYPF